MRERRPKAGPKAKVQARSVPALPQGRADARRRGRYIEPVVITRRDRVWRGSDGRYYCRRSNGTTGLVLGAAAGALGGGRELDGGRDRTLGTVGGGLLGREIDRGSLRCR